MEFSDYIAVIRRRWATILVIALVLGFGLSLANCYQERRTYVAEAQVGIRDEERFVTPTELAPFIAPDSSGYGYYTREALINSRQVYLLAGALYLALQDSPPLPREFWKARDDSLLIGALVAHKDGLLARDRAGKPLLSPYPVPPAGLRLIRSYTLSEDAVKPAAARLKAAVSTAKPNERVQIIYVRATAGDPDEARLMANVFSRAAQIYSRVQSTQVLDSAARNVEENIRSAEERLEAKRREFGISEEDIRDLERRLSVATAAAYDLERQIEEVRTRQDKASARVRSLETLEHRLREALPAGPEGENLSSPLLDRVRNDMTALRTDLAMRKLTWTPRHPEYLRMQERLKQLQDEYRSELYRVRGQAILGLRDDIGEFDIDLQNLQERRMRKVQELRALTDEMRVRDPARAEAALMRREVEGYHEMLRRLDSARAFQQGFYAFEEVAEDAPLQDLRATRVIPLYALLAVMIAFAAAFLLEYVDTSIRTDYDVRRHLNMPALALIEDAKGQDPLILRASPRDPLSEQFNMTATVLRSYMSERGFKTVVVCSAVPQEGKTTIAANLGVAMARKGLRVAVVDTDLRIPQMHAIFGLDNSRGLSNLLRGEEAEGGGAEGLLGYTEIPTLRVLPSGPMPEAPIELLESPRMVELIRWLKESFDLVICDSPPITSVGDTLTLAKLVDTNVLVVRSGVSDRRMVTWTKQLLANVRADVAGAVLNFAPARAGGRYYYYSAGARGEGVTKALRTRD